MSKRYKARRRQRYYAKRYDLGIENTPCWCGETNPYYAPAHQTCGGLGVINCLCGGDFCVCHNHGEIECFGCEDCEGDADDYDQEFYDQQDGWNEQ